MVTNDEATELPDVVKRALVWSSEVRLAVQRCLASEQVSLLDGCAPQL